MRYYLCTTGISEIWDLDSRLLLLGPWCLAKEGNKKLLERREYQLVPSPWEPANKIKEAADYCHNIYLNLLPQLAEMLNSIHQVSYPVRYWQILIGPWLLYFIGIFYERYRRIENVLQAFPSCHTHVLPAGQCKISSFNTFDFFQNRISEDHYNFVLFSLIAYDLSPKNLKETSNGFQSEVNIQMPKNSWKGVLFNRFLKRLNSILKCPIILSDMHHLTPIDMLLFKLNFKTKHPLGFVNFIHTDNLYLKNNYSIDFRKTLNIKDASDRFQQLLYKVVPYAIPMCYVENYKSYKNNIENVDYMKVIGSSVGWYVNEDFKFFAAEAITRGVELVDFQHGGGYGFNLSIPHETLSLEKDTFYTWGWNSRDIYKTKLLPSPHLSKLKDVYSMKCNKILFIGTGMPTYHYLFNTGLMPEDMIKCLENKILFLQNLSDETKNKILYRPYPYIEYGWGEIEIVKRICPTAQFIPKGKLINYIKKVKLVVIDHPHTSFLEALTINAPCIFYWDHDVYLMRPEAEEYFTLLRKAGILYRCPLDAAKKVNEIFFHPKDWWLSQEVQDARLKFCEHFAYARKDWMKIWLKEFKGLQNAL